MTTSATRRFGHTSSGHFPRPRWAGVLCAAWVIALAGCGSSGTAESANPTPLTPSDFAASPGEADAAQTMARPPRAAPPAAPAQASDIPTDVVVVAGAPEVASVPVVTLNATEFEIDQLVGQINGRPVYADEFFRPMDERFRREAERRGQRDFMAFARKEIEGALWDKLRDELLLSEFEGALTPEQRMGVLAFVEDVRRDLVSGNLGSEALATQRLREAEGLGLEEKVQDLTQRRFILEQLRRAIGNRVTVSAADVRLYYEQNLNEFSPPPVAKFVILRVPRKDEAKIAAVEAALAAGTPFEDVAREHSTWRPTQNNAHEATLKDRVYAEAAIFGPASLNTAARALSVGQVSPRVDERDDAYWIKLVEIEQKPGVSLYDAQEGIERTLRAQRSREEEVRYFEQLFRRGSFSDVREMVRRLLEFAGERYLILKPGEKREPVNLPPTVKPSAPAAEPAPPTNAPAAPAGN